VFIPVAEKTGLIVQLGNQILERACEWMARWQRARTTDPPLSLSVNLSARQLQQPEIVEAVSKAMARSGLQPGSLVLELTESVIMQDAEATLTRLRQFKELGVRLALDDFGTGYSSLSYLCRFPVDILKIDRLFVTALRTGGDARRLTEAIMGIVKMLGLDAVAEGIDGKEELAALRRLGCPFGQGYYFAHPLPPEEFEHFLELRHPGLLSAGGRSNS
jgi:EAL domain-containing protein (putative c-di-GMP-specific phosphodiesterase class I)